MLEFEIICLLLVLILVAFWLLQTVQHDNENLKTKLKSQLLGEPVGADLINPSDFFLNSVDREYAQAWLDRSRTELAVSTPFADKNNYARDLYYTSLYKGSFEGALTAWKTNTKLETLADFLWEGIFTLEDGDWYSFKALSLSGLEPGSFALPYYLLTRTNRYVVDMPALLPHTWIYPTTNIDDLYVLKKMKVPWDSVVDDVGIRWYHVVACNYDFELPQVTSTLTSSLFAQAERSDLYEYGVGTYSLYPQSWFGFLHGHKVNANKIQFNEGGTAENARSKSLLLHGKFTFLIPASLNTTKLLFSSGASWTDVLNPRESVTIYLKQVLIRCWRRIYIYNAGPDPIALQHLNNSFSITSSDEQSVLILDSNLEWRRDHQVRKERRHVKTTTDKSAESTILTPSSALLVCGPKQ